MSVDMQFDLLLSGGKTKRNGTPWRSGKGELVHAGSLSLGWGYSNHYTVLPHLLSKYITSAVLNPPQGGRKPLRS